MKRLDALFLARPFLLPHVHCLIWHICRRFYHRILLHDTTVAVFVTIATTTNEWKRKFFSFFSLIKHANFFYFNASSLSVFHLLLYHLADDDMCGVVFSFFLHNFRLNLLLNKKILRAQKILSNCEKRNNKSMKNVNNFIYIMMLMMLSTQEA